jgi:hypothetical protein
MKKGDVVWTPRFLNVRLEEVFSSYDDAVKAGYTEPTHQPGVVGKSLNQYHMVFAGFKR